MRDYEAMRAELDVLFGPTRQRRVEARTARRRRIYAQIRERAPHWIGGWHRERDGACAACGSMAGDEYHCPDCGEEVPL